MCSCGGELTVWCFDCGDWVCDDCGCQADHDAELRCPDCSLPHDPRRCAEEGAVCDCCSVLFSSWDERDAWVGAS